MNALINLKDCKEFMVVTINNKDHQIKLAGTIDDPYFCGSDVCVVLGYVDIKKALQRCVDDKDDKKSLKELNNEVGAADAPTSILGKYHKILSFNDGRAVYVSEAGLYNLIMSSQAPFAKEFRKLVCKVILPSIRKYGSYTLEKEFKEKLALKDKTEQELKEQVQKAEIAAKKAESRALTLEALSVAHRERLKNQIFYIVTTKAIAKDGEFKIGGIEPKGISTKSAVQKRLASYNTGTSGVHPETRFYFVALFEVSNYRQVEARVKELLAPFRSKRHSNSENFNLHFNILKPLIDMIVENYNEEIDKLNEFVKAILDSHTTEYIEHVIPDAVDIDNIPGEYNVVVVKRKFGEQVNKKVKMSELSDEELKELLSHVVDGMVKNRTTVEIKRTEVEKVLDNNYVLKDHKNRIWGLMKGIIEKAGRKPKYN
ncbi:MAG: BRO family protein [Cetobacterium sp.]